MQRESKFFKEVDCKKFSEMVGYNFKNKALVIEALTHSSYANELHDGTKYNERLEFLGDSVLSIVVSDYIYKNCPELPEGKLTKLRAALVCERSLYGYAKQIKIGEFIRLSKGEFRNGGSDRPSILSDAFEAVIAAIYLDGGMEEAKKFILRFVVPDIKSAKPFEFKDYKTILQEIVQKNPEERLTYVLVKETGPDHDKHFVFEVHLNSNVIGKGGGRSKKEAEQEAARVALELMGY